MPSVEMCIVWLSLLAAGLGSLVLLACLAGKRAQLVQAYNIEQEAIQREETIEQNRKKLKSLKDQRKKKIPNRASAK